MERTMNFSKSGETRLRPQDEVPGVGDVVWAILSRHDFGSDPARLLFVSAEAGAGTTSIAAATAMALVQDERVPVALVETNCVRPAVSEYLGIPPTGLTDLSDGQAELEQCIHRSPDCPDLYVMPAGTRGSFVRGEFTSPLLHSILKALCARVRYLILDAPPLLAHLESRLLLQHADEAILVARSRRTRRDKADLALEILREARMPVLGAVFNDFGLVPEPAEASSLDDVEDRNGSGRSWNGHAIAVTDARRALVDPADGIDGAQGENEVDALRRRVAKLSRLLERVEDPRRLAPRNGDAGE
jgi:Mrp family chromosome partitioning ATPase